MRNSIFGIVAGWEEVITPLELTLELYTRAIEASVSPDGGMVQGILTDYQAYAGNPNEVTVFAPEQVTQLVQSAAQVSLDADFLQTAYNDIAAYRQVQKDGIKRK
jgi:hypothetical protein